MEITGAERWAGYAEAHLTVTDLNGATVLVRPQDGSVGAFPFDAPAHVLTASNPGTHRLDAADNDRRHRALLADLPVGLRRWTAEAGAGDGSHEEASIVVVGLSDDEALAVGRRWGQDAVFRWTAEAWTLLPCDDGPSVSRGWSAVETPLTLTVEHSTGAYERWTVRPEGAGRWIVRHSDGHERTIAADGLPAMVAGSPALRDLVPGTASTYVVDTHALRGEDLVAALTVRGEGAEDSSRWTGSDDVESWTGSDDWLDECFPDLSWTHRWVLVNGNRVSVLTTPLGPRAVMLEDDVQLAVVEGLASHSWSSDGGGRPMSTDGGNSLGWLAEGLLYDHQWGDFGPERSILAVEATGEAIGLVVAEWVRRVEIEQQVALTQEPLNPTSSTAEHDRLARVLELCEFSLDFPTGDVGRIARERLAEASERYRRTRRALAEPGSEDGRSLAAVLRAVDGFDEVADVLVFGSWLN